MRRSSASPTSPGTIPISSGSVIARPFGGRVPAGRAPKTCPVAIEPRTGQLRLADHPVAPAEAVAAAGKDEEASRRSEVARPGAPREQQARLVGADAEKRLHAPVGQDGVEHVLDLGERRRGHRGKRMASAG